MTQSTKAEIMRPNKFPEKIFQEELNQDDLDDWDDGTLPSFHFLENKRLLDIVSTEFEGIGSVETERNQSSANGKVNSEAIAGRQEQFVLTRLNRWRTPHGDSDWVTLEIRYFQGDTNERRKH